MPSFSAKAILDSLTETCNRRTHVLRACRSKCGTEVQARQGTGILSLEPRSSGHEHTPLDARVEYFLLNLQEASRAGAGVLGVVNGEPELWKQVSESQKAAGERVSRRREMKKRLTNMPAAGGVQLTRSRGRLSSHAASNASLFLVYSSRRFISHRR